jgi:hypothetical protein
MIILKAYLTAHHSCNSQNINGYTVHQFSSSDTLLGLGSAPSPPPPPPLQKNSKIYLYLLISVFQIWFLIQNRKLFYSTKKYFKDLTFAYRYIDCKHNIKNGQICKF